MSSASPFPSGVLVRSQGCYCSCGNLLAELPLGVIQDAMEACLVVGSLYCLPRSFARYSSCSLTFFLAFAFVTLGAVCGTNFTLRLPSVRTSSSAGLFFDDMVSVVRGGSGEDGVVRFLRGRCRTQVNVFRLDFSLPGTRGG